MERNFMQRFFLFCLPWRCRLGMLILLGGCLLYRFDAGHCRLISEKLCVEEDYTVEEVRDAVACTCSAVYHGVSCGLEAVMEDVETEKEGLGNDAFSVAEPS